jgi:uncharacterized protein
MKEHVVRLKPGEDLLEAISSYCSKHVIEAAYIGTCVGSLSTVTFRKGYTKTQMTLRGTYEIVSAVGTLSKGGHHIHMSVSDSDFQVLGGHIDRNTVVLTTVELVLIELESFELVRTIDATTGYKTLVVNDARSKSSS